MRSPARDGEVASHPSFVAARQLSALAKASQTMGIALAMVLVMGALTWPPLTWGVWTLPAWAAGRPLGAFLTGWNKRMHPCIVDLFYRALGVKLMLYGDTPVAGVLLDLHTFWMCFIPVHSACCVGSVTWWGQSRYTSWPIISTTTTMLR